MSQKYEKLKTLLKELFQLDQPDLDFGLYRIMHAKSAEVSQFLDRDLLPQVQTALGQYKTADKAELEKELAKVIAGIEAAGMDPAQSPKVADLRARLKTDAVDVGALESEIYDHLFSFFRRYYSEGDFLAKRVYKPGVYAIPYEGEEVTLHWANKDQYYIKTAEYLRDYAFCLHPQDAFRLRPDDDKQPMRVHFRLADAAEGEHGNVKAAEGKDRVFIMAAGGESGRDFIVEEAGEQGTELILRFEYRPATLTDWPEDVRDGKSKPPAQKDLSALAARRVLAVTEIALAPWIAELGKPHVTASGEKADYTRIETHLRRYTARNTFDYFIHKDLGTFLRRELDFYIKNEVMHLDDVENETAPRVDQYLSKIKIIRKIAGKIIAFLAQLEDFQKKLWLKKKFVVETQWCIRVGCIPEAFHTEIAANDAQHAEWVKLFAIEEIQGDLIKPGYSKPLTPAFLKAHPTLVVDTRHFDAGFTARLLEAIGDVDTQADGVLFHSENFQALSLMQTRYREQVKCIYIDPPYNTGGDGFAYKDSYQYSSWLSMLSDRLEGGRTLTSHEGSIFLSIDDGCSHLLKSTVASVYGPEQFIAQIIWKKRSTPPNDKVIGAQHEYVLGYSVDRNRVELNHRERGEERVAKYTNPDNHVKGPYVLGDLQANVKGGRYVQSLAFAITNPLTGEKHFPRNSGNWRFNEEKIDRLIATNEIAFGTDGRGWPKLKRFLRDVKEGITYTTLWDFLPMNSIGSQELADTVAGPIVFENPKPVGLISEVCRLASTGECLILDFFAGSGTTGHAVINLNREDAGQRKFILVEMGDYFDTVLLPRIKKVSFSPEWKDGKPKRFATPEEAERSPRIVKVVRLESYEDTLNNLEARRTDQQQLLLDTAQAQGADGLKAQYLLRYLLEVETRGSQSLLNVQAFSDPTAYKLKVKRPGSDESREVNVDLLETFNWLIGLTVQHIAAPQTFNSAFERDSEKRLRLSAKGGGRLKQDAAGPYWFRTVTGTTPDGRKALVIWRKLTGEPEQDNLVLDEWFTKQGYSAKDSEFDLIYVNGGNNLENIKTPDDRWKVRLLEEDFHRLMFATEGG